jgi:hypothetical protein
MHAAIESAIFLSADEREMLCDGIEAGEKLYRIEDRKRDSDYSDRKHAS